MSGNSDSPGESGGMGVIELPPGRPVVAGRSGECDVVVEHPTVSRRHARLTARDGCVHVEDLGSRHGTLIKDGQALSGVLRPGDTVRFGSGPVYRLSADGTHLVCEGVGGGMEVELEGVSVDRDGATLLEDVNILVAAGSFMGIIGVSGGGKSLLAGCLTTTVRPTRGEIRFDGGRSVAAWEDEYRSYLGVVPQDDLVHMALTVRENVRFAAELRRPGATDAEINQRVEEALKAVGLADRADRCVAVLSGGERKRVSIAIELLSRPRLLVLDEPTSGLDPSMQAEVMEVLRSLARSGITVVCTTHTTETLHFFDTVAALGFCGDRRMVRFCGPPADLWRKFDVQPGAAAELYRRLAVSADTSVRRPPTRPGGRSRHTSAGVVPNRMAEGLSICGQANLILRRSLLSFLREGGAGAAAGEPAGRKGPRWLWRRCPNAVMAVMQPAALAAAIVIAQHNQSKSTFIHFFLIVAAIWLGMTLTVREIVREVRERPLYQRDRLAGLRPAAYLAGKLAFGALLALAQSAVLYLTARCLVYFLITAQTNELARDALLGTSVIRGLGVLFIASISGVMVGLLVSTLASSERAAVAMLPLVILPQVLFSRVGYGQGGETWREPSPVGPLASIDRFFRSDEAGFASGTVALVSLAMPSRPALGIIDMHVDRVAGWDVWAEAFHLVALILGYGLLVYWSFMRAERGWLRLR